MAHHIKRNNLTATIDNQRNRALLPEHEFDWIEKKGRQATWLLRKAEHTYKGKPIFPINLTPRERLVAWFDYGNIEKTEKLDILKDLNKAWVKQQLQDKALSWYASAGNRRRTDGSTRAPEPIAPGVCALLAHQPTYSGELGTGSGQTQRPSRLTDSSGREAS
jgi:hypothetical protein